MTRSLFASVATGLVLVLAVPAVAQEIVSAMTPELVDEAIRFAADDKASARFLGAYVVQTRSGLGDGPLIGIFTTPFSRVVRAAVAARQKKTPFGVADVGSELIAPEIHVVATSQKAWAADDTTIASVQSVVLIRRDGANEVVVQPLRTVELTTTQYRTLNGFTSSDAGVVAIFPIAALTPGTAIRVTFDRVARGFSGLSMCRDCVIPLDFRRIR